MHQNPSGNNNPNKKKKRKRNPNSTTGEDPNLPPDGKSSLSSELESIVYRASRPKRSRVSYHSNEESTSSLASTNAATTNAIISPFKQQLSTTTTTTTMQTSSNSPSQNAASAKHQNPIVSSSASLYYTEEKPLICRPLGAATINSHHNENHTSFSQSSYTSSSMPTSTSQQSSSSSSLIQSNESTTTVSKVSLSNISQLMDTILKSRYIVFFTGSGISKNAGLSTYRDDPNGIYEQIKRGKRAQDHQFFDTSKVYLPTKTHMAIAELMRLKKAHFIITQNCDNLHERSGVSWNELIELHGNMYLLRCKECKSIFEMDEVQMQPVFVHHRDLLRKHKSRATSKGSSHSDTSCKKETPNSAHPSSSHIPPRIIKGKTCFNCGKTDVLEHTITNFGEPIEQHRWNIAHEEAEKADLMIVLGSSCAVAPANLLPTLSSHLAICNLSTTPLDHEADFKCEQVTSDEFMEHIMNGMCVPIPSYELKLRIEIGLTPGWMKGEDGDCFRICNVDDIDVYVKRIVVECVEEEASTLKCVDHNKQCAASRFTRFELTKTNDYCQYLPHDQSFTRCKFSFTAHFNTICQLEESQHSLTLCEGTGYEELFSQETSLSDPNLEHVVEYSLQCRIHDEKQAWKQSKRIVVDE